MDLLAAFLRQSSAFARDVDVAFGHEHIAFRGFCECMVFSQRWRLLGGSLYFVLKGAVVLFEPLRAHLNRQRLESG